MGEGMFSVNFMCFFGVHFVFFFVHLLFFLVHCFLLFVFSLVFV